jgi:hypothetical protein
MIEIDEKLKQMEQKAEELMSEMALEEKKK